MNIHALEHNDIGLLTELQPEGWSDILPTIAFYTKATFCFPMKVTIDKKIVGIGTGIVHKNTAWLAHIIVHPHYRNKGIGRLITQTLVDSLQTKNCDTIYLIATEFGEPVYKKVGFITETEYLFFKDIQADKNRKKSNNIAAFTDDFKDQIAAIDRQVSGEERMIQIEQHLNNGFLYLQNNDVEGFYLPTFGDGLIIANTAFAGIELMKLRLTTTGNASFPIDNITAVEFMHQNNFQEFKTAKRMRLGAKRIWEPKNIYNRIGGNLG